MTRLPQNVKVVLKAFCHSNVCIIVKCVQEIERLREENEKLKLQVSSAEGVAHSASTDRRSVEQQLQQLKRELERKQTQTRVSTNHFIAH